MNLVLVLSILLASGCAIVATVVLQDKGLRNFFHHRKGINQVSLMVTCPKCGLENKRQRMSQICKKCYSSF
ncbi:hypothetical protein [Bacillus sp. CGMCC 1.16541]|uniref:hypothetical protein n=1 Tax=Bacillus sp. CGMCC 1.16541 TaxID=2185143 RepID=UPI000D726CF2|nr:hypothetical protein [Bacillus sp. CGMCC 1.16541]